MTDYIIDPQKNTNRDLPEPRGWTRDEYHAAVEKSVKIGAAVRLFVQRMEEDGVTGVNLMHMVASELMRLHNDG